MTVFMPDTKGVIIKNNIVATLLDWTLRPRQHAVCSCLTQTHVVKRHWDAPT